MKSFYKVLIVDDDQIINFLHRHLLEELNAAEHIVVKENGADALAFIKHHCIEIPTDCVSLILLDINMPIMNGLELLQELKNLGQTELINSRIAVITTSLHPTDLALLTKLGVRNVLEKPLTKEKLISLIQTFNHDKNSFFLDKHNQ